MSNLQKSEKLIADILLKLAENGVRKTNIGTPGFWAKPTVPDADFFENAIEWLVSDGVIQSEGIMTGSEGPHELYSECVLTSYGFKVLERDFGGDGTKLAVAIKNTSEGGRSYANIGDLFGGILGGFTKSMGNQ